MNALSVFLPENAIYRGYDNALYFLDGYLFRSHISFNDIVFIVYIDEWFVTVISHKSIMEPQITGNLTVCFQQPVLANWKSKCVSST